MKMKQYLFVLLCFTFLGCFSKGEINMFSKKKIEKIIKNKSGQDAIIEIDIILSDIFYKNPEKLSIHEKNIVYIEEFEREVNNGGFSQYFSNSSGNNALETLNALNLINSKIFKKILENAIDKFPNRIVPKDRDEREELLMDIENNNADLWDELDNEFYEYEEDIYILLIEYIKNNIKDFR